MKNLFIILFLVSSLKCFSQTLSINIPLHHFEVDKNINMVLSHLDNVETYSDLSAYTEILITLDQELYTFNSVPSSLNFSESYLVSNTSGQYTLYFTQLPVISISTSDLILNEPKIAADFIYSDKEQVVVSTIGIEIRGISSQTYPKKTYDLEFWEDTIGEIEKDVQFGFMRKDDDWILDALYNEPLRIRSNLSHNLWLQLHEPYYLDEESKAKSGAAVDFVELFLNQEYQGIYNLSEQIDKKLLQITSYKEETRGELYKGANFGATLFNELPNYDNNLRAWGGIRIEVS